MTLSARFAAAKPEETRELLEELFGRMWHDPVEPIEENGMCAICRKFYDILNIGTDEAFLGAALMLVPEGWPWRIDTSDCVTRFQAALFHGHKGRMEITDGKTPALALAAAIARSVE